MYKVLLTEANFDGPGGQYGRDFYEEELDTGGRISVTPRKRSAIPGVVVSFVAPELQEVFRGYDNVTQALDAVGEAHIAESVVIDAIDEVTQSDFDKFRQEMEAELKRRRIALRQE